MRADGTDQRPLITHEGTDAGAKYSPDGRRIAFFSDREGNARLYSAAADGTDLKSLTTDSTSYEFAWSPDSRQIAFYTACGSIDARVVTHGAARRASRRVLARPNAAGLAASKRGNRSGGICRIVATLISAAVIFERAFGETVAMACGH